VELSVSKHAAGDLTGSEPVFRDVLCAVDGTRGSFAAVEQAAALVGEGGRLTLLAVTSVSGAGHYRTAAISPQRVERVLGRAAELARALGVQTARMIDPAGPAAEVILAAAAVHELLALGAPSASPLGGLLIGGVASSALTSFSKPLLAARPLRSREDFGRCLLVSSDGGPGSDAVVELGCRLAAARGARVVLVHTVGSEAQARPHQIEHQAHDLELSAPGGCEVRVLTCGPREAIVETAASVGASLIVMGSRRLAGLRALGSVSQHVVRAAPCSVLLVPPAEVPGS